MGRASDRPLKAPVVSGSAGYSGTPLPKKLGIRPGAKVLLLGAPADFPQTLGELPEGARLQTKPGGPAQLILLFVKSRAELARRFPAGRKAFAPNASMWIAWPKQASGVATDLKESVVQGVWPRRRTGGLQGLRHRPHLVRPAVHRAALPARWLTGAALRSELC
jgi:hypothetical protein